MASARDRLGLARTALDAGFHSGAVGAAYYAMLYAARAALSEADRNAKTHRGTWTLFREVYVEPGRFERELFAWAQDAQPLREGVDYDALEVQREEAETLLEQAKRFVAAVAEVLR